LSELSLPGIGLGTYLGATDGASDAAYAAAIEQALRSGINLLDTAINYRHQRSERNIGAALAKLISAGEVQRDEVFVCSKAGYLAFDGDVPADARAWVETEFFASGIVPEEQRNLLLRSMHCMAPSYLADQLERSRRNLGLETIDLYYVHNPESELGLVPPAEFMRRIHEAFAFLESAVRDRKIRFYGAATWNGFRAAPGEREHIPLRALVDAALETGGDDHHFRFIQLPFNLAMPQAYSSQTQIWEGEPMSAMEAARRAGIAVVTSATLFQGQLAEGLPDFVRKRLGMDSDAANAIQFARSAPGVTTALIGMGRKEHVEANVAVARKPLAEQVQWKKLFSRQ
jgi:aryl-alcohol dehydrogenase-like predicted oxidoreductase